MYGWSPQYPLSALTVSGTAAKYGINNTPTDPAVLANLSRVSDFLATLPFTFRIGPVKANTCRAKQSISPR